MCTYFICFLNEFFELGTFEEWVRVLEQILKVLEHCQI